MVLNFSGELKLFFGGGGEIFSGWLFFSCEIKIEVSSWRRDFLMGRGRFPQGNGRFFVAVKDFIEGEVSFL